MAARPPCSGRGPLSHSLAWRRRSAEGEDPGRGPARNHSFGHEARWLVGHCRSPVRVLPVGFVHVGKQMTAVAHKTKNTRDEGLSERYRAPKQRGIGHSERVRARKAPVEGQGGLGQTGIRGAKGAQARTATSSALNP